MKLPKLILTYAALLILSTLPCQARSGPFTSNPDDLYLIKRTLQYYFFGAYIHNVDKLSLAYHPQAQLTYIDVETGAYHNLHVGAYLSQLTETAPNKVKQELKVLKIDITGQAAMIRTQILFPTQGKRINDFLSLLKIDGEWRIIRRTSYKEYAKFEGIGLYKKSKRRWVNDHESIQLALNKYLKGSNRYDLDALKTVFHPEADFAYIDPRKGTFHKMYIDGYLDMQAVASTKNYKRQYEIESVEIAGNTAIAKVKIRYKKMRTYITDYISFVKIKGNWKIIHKVSNKEAGALLLPV